MPVNLIIRNPLDWDALAIARNANGANRRELSDYVRFLKAQAVWTDLTFFRDFANAKSLNHSFGPNINFTRNSVATYFDAGGTLRTAIANEPRFDHDASNNNSLGLLIEEARTNSIRNSQAGGASAGTPGTMPTHWSTFTALTGLTQQISTGTEGGLAYVEIRVNGTPSAAGTYGIYFEVYPGRAASSGQVWTSSQFCRLTAGSLAGVSSVSHIVAQIDSTPATITSSSASIIPTAASLASQRFALTTPALSATVATLLPYYDLNLDGNPIDITLRIAAPQLEQGAFPTSYIPTTSAAVTRQADIALVDPVSSFYNQSTGTLFAEFSRPQVSKFSSFLHFDDTTGNEMIALETGVAAPATQRFQVIDGNSAQALIGNYTSATANTVYRMAGAYAVNDFAVSQDGSAAATDTGGTLPTITRMAFSVTPSATYIRKVAYYPKRLSNALLQSLTT